MITGYKKKKLGHPSEKLSGDVPRATLRNVLFSEVVFPIVMAVLFVIAYLFVKSFPVDGQLPPAPLIRIAVISLGPILWNGAVLLTLFFFSLLLGPMLDPILPMFGSVMAFIAHTLAVIGMIAFFEFFVSIVPMTVLTAYALFSGSLSFGILLMLSSASLLSSLSSVPFTRF